MSRLSPLPRSRSRASVAASDTTYHSFHEADLYESAIDPSPSSHPIVYHDAPPVKESEPPTSSEMRRQDSGYESLPPRTSQSSRRRTSTTSASSSSGQWPRTRPSIRRSARSGPVASVPKGSLKSLYLTRSHQSYQAQNAHHPATFFHFPSPDPPVEDEQDLIDDDAAQVESYEHAQAYTSGFGFNFGFGPFSPPAPTRTETPSQPLPPQTTHYWTSDRTRRLEYAAIDAASRGVKGWVLKHMVPECFVPKERRRIGFDDDRGSVRRYRLELENEVESGGEKDGPEEAQSKKWTWFRGS